MSDTNQNATTVEINEKNSTQQRKQAANAAVNYLSELRKELENSEDPSMSGRPTSKPIGDTAMSYSLANALLSSETASFEEQRNSFSRLLLDTKFADTPAQAEAYTQETLRRMPHASGLEIPTTSITEEHAASANANTSQIEIK